MKTRYEDASPSPSLGLAISRSHGARMVRFGNWDAAPWAMTYRAVDKVLHRDVALKVIQTPAAADGSRAVRERFLREARAAAALRHPNVAGVFHLSASPEVDHCYFAMELVEGETLEARVRRDGPIKVDLVVEIGIQVTRALTAAAARGLIHRDLKPGNIMLTRERGRVDWRGSESDRFRFGQGGRGSRSRNGSDAWRICRNAGLRQSRTVRERRGRCAIRYLRARRYALVCAHWACAVFRHHRRRDAGFSNAHATAGGATDRKKVPPALVTLLRSCLASRSSRAARFGPRTDGSIGILPRASLAKRTERAARIALSKSRLKDRAAGRGDT